ncbi:hydrophobin [Mycena albidolilacea]|uniref:Hydrophobin n=1 Tax=Mycena albidolilacea TaxID=1033008 RepID=A0AAD6ZHP8_9AGAR|nr:hydrophobin [Mycena albidolilacea]
MAHRSDREATTLSQCPTGDAQCCDSVDSVQSAAVTALLGVLGIAVSDNTITAGLSCAPIVVIGVGGGDKCALSPVCRSNNDFNGLVSLGCTPISL